MSLECGGCRGLRIIRNLRKSQRFYWRSNSHRRPHKQHYTFAPFAQRREREYFWRRKNHTKHNDEVFACCENVYPWKWGGESGDGARPWLGHYQSIQSSQSDALLQNHNLQPQNKCNSCPPPKNAWRLHHSPWQDECVTRPRLLHLIQQTKGFRYWSVDFIETAWCHFWLFSQIL